MYSTFHRSISEESFDWWVTCQIMCIFSPIFVENKCTTYTQNGRRLRKRHLFALLEIVLLESFRLCLKYPDTPLKRGSGIAFICKQTRMLRQTKRRLRIDWLSTGQNALPRPQSRQFSFLDVTFSSSKWNDWRRVTATIGEDVNIWLFIPNGQRKVYNASA